MAVYDSSGRREVRARKAYKCAHCGGDIDRRELYINYHDGRGGNWKGREHIDCNAAWWQGDASHLLSAVGSTPGKNPPADEVQSALEDIDVLVREISAAGYVQLVFSPEYRQRLLHAKNHQLRSEALTQIGRAHALFAECLMEASGHKKKSLQLSHLLQQMAQVTDIDPHRS